LIATKISVAILSIRMDRHKVRLNAFIRNDIVVSDN